MLQFFLGCKMRYWTKPQSQMYMNMCKCSTEIINDVIAVLRRHFCFFVFFLCSSVTSLLFFEFCVVLLLFHVELCSARAFETVRRSSLQYRITSLLQFNMTTPVFVILNHNRYGNMVLIGTGKGEVPYLPQLLMEHNETSVKHLSYSIL